MQRVKRVMVALLQKIRIPVNGHCFVLMLEVDEARRVHRRAAIHGVPDFPGAKASVRAMKRGRHQERS